MFVTLNTSGKASAAVASYADAQRNLAAAQPTPTGRRKVMKDYGWSMGGKNTRIRDCADGRIIMRLYNTDVVTWMPDNSFAIDNWSSQLTGQFISRFTPLSGGADSTLTYFPVAAPMDDWRARWRAAKIVHGDVFFTPTGDDTWEPDLDTCDTFRSIEVDKTGTRAVLKEHHLALFRDWLVMAPNMLDLQHQGEDLDAVAEALKAKRFREAAVHLPQSHNLRGFGLRDRVKPIKMGNVSWDAPVTMSALDRVRDYIYDQAGLLTEVETKVMTPSELAQATKRNAEYARANVGNYRLGWTR